MTRNCPIDDWKIVAFRDSNSHVVVKYGAFFCDRVRREEEKVPDLYTGRNDEILRRSTMFTPGLTVRLQLIGILVATLLMTSLLIKETVVPAWGQVATNEEGDQNDEGAQVANEGLLLPIDGGSC